MMGRGYNKGVTSGYTRLHVSVALMLPASDLKSSLSTTGTRPSESSPRKFTIRFGILLQFSIGMFIVGIWCYYCDASNIHDVYNHNSQTTDLHFH